MWFWKCWAPSTPFSIASADERLNIAKLELFSGQNILLALGMLRNGKLVKRPQWCVMIMSRWPAIVRESGKKKIMMLSCNWDLKGSSCHPVLLMWSHLGAVRQKALFWLRLLWIDCSQMNQAQTSGAIAKSSSENSLTCCIPLPSWKIQAKCEEAQNFKLWVLLVLPTKLFISLQSKYSPAFRRSLDSFHSSDHSCSQYHWAWNVYTIIPKASIPSLCSYVACCLPIIDSTQ